MEASEAAAALGRIRTEKKSAASAQNAAKARERFNDPALQAEANRKRSDAQKARWAAVRQAKAENAPETGAQGQEGADSE